MTGIRTPYQINNNIYNQPNTHLSTQCVGSRYKNTRCISNVKTVEQKKIINKHNNDDYQGL